MWLAILVTIIASAGNNVGKALQKEATRQLPRFSIERKILLQYARSRQYLVGLAADLGGAVLMIAAFALAPVSLVQPVSGLGLAMLSIFSHFYLKERLQGSEWAAVCVAALGTIGIGATSAGDAAGDDAGTPSIARIIGVLGLLCIAVLADSFLRYQRASQDKRSAKAAQPSASAGACFGLSAACCRTGFLLARRLTWLAAPAGLCMSIVFSSLGFMLQTLGFKDGHSVIVCTCAAVSSMVTGVLVGLLALGEGMPSTLRMQALRLLSWLCITAGVSALAGGKGGLNQVASALASRVPSTVLSRLPSRVALSVRNLSQTKSEQLPTHAGAEVDFRK
ncbi:g243 [Coccomyxa viridis]|uniref:G243 protein n=1 Tax=Coccomyxa viridis TaxID=1274662 RepID=A0ABP1FLY7_9CHLO